MTRIDLPGKRKKGHLTLLRQPRSITSREFNALTLAERLDMVRAVPSRQKYELILEANEPEVLIRRLSVQELYLMVKELGPEDVPELFSLVNTEQFTTFIDLDCWRQDLFDAPAALRWITLLLEAGEEKILETVDAFDFELLVLTFKKLLDITRGPEDVEDEEELAELMRRTGGYEIECRDPEHAKIVFAFLDILFRMDHPLYMRLIAAVRWEHETALEEEVYRFRIGRLQDRGFPDPFEALAVYAWMDPEGFDPLQHRKSSMEPGEEGVEAPGFVLASARPRDLLAEVLAAGIDHETAWELTFLLNKVMVADRIDMGEAVQVQNSMEEVYRYLNIALEHLSDGDSARAADLMEGVYLQSLFRLGFSLTLVLQRRAGKVRESKIVPYLDGPFRALIDALGRKKPAFYEGMEAEDRGGERPFANLRELRLAEEWLDRLEVQRRLFEIRFPFELPAVEDLKLDGCVPDDSEDLALSDFLLTALANRVLGRAFIPRPIPSEELPALHAKVCGEGKVSGELRLETRHWLDSLEPGAGAFGDYCLDVWDEEFCSYKPAEIDPRFVGGMIVKL
jgi:hypothetical protein